MPVRSALSRSIRPALAAAYLILCAVFLARIGRGEIVPVRGHDTCPYLIMADQPWTSPEFYRGPRPPTVPAIWSFFSGGRDATGIILFQVAFQALAWLFFGWTAAAGLRNRILGDTLFGVLLTYSLARGIHQDGARLLSESISLSLALTTAALLLRCFRAPTPWRALAVAPAALLLAFARDANAWLLLGAAAGIAAWAGIRWARATAPRPRPSLPLLLLSSGFAALFAISAAGAASIAQPGGEACYGAEHPLVRHDLAGRQGPRHLFPLLNIFGMRILPYDFRVRWFEERGLPAGAVVRAKAFQWACQRDWEWYWRDSLQEARGWLEHDGRRQYAAYLWSHPGYAWIRPWPELAPIYLRGPAADSGFAAAFLDPLAPALDFAFGPAKLFVTAALFALWIASRRPGAGSPPSGLTGYALALGLAALMALFIYHGDAMDLERHSRGNVVFLDMTLALGAFALADRAGRVRHAVMERLARRLSRAAARRGAPSVPGVR